MNRKFILMTANATKEQRDYITTFFTHHVTFNVWHWIDDVWILVHSKDFYDAKNIWQLVRNLPGMADVTGVCFEVHGTSEYYGTHSPACWEWLRDNWNLP